MPQLPGSLSLVGLRLSPRVGAALVLLLLALGLPWGVVGPESYFVAGWYTAGSCVLDTDGFMWCDPGYLSPGYTMAGPGAPMSGYLSPARVFLVVVVAILVWGAYRASTSALGWAIGLTAVAVLLTGTALRTGAIAAILALVLLVLERRALGRAGESVVRAGPPGLT